MENKTFYLVRHGLATKSTIGYGNTLFTAAILPESIPVIKRIALFLANIPTDYNASSEFPRCRQTANIITKNAGKQFYFDNRLNEYHPKSLESFSTFHNRIQNFLDDIAKKEAKHILIVTHGAGIAAIKSFVLKNEFGLPQLFDYPKTGTLLIIKEMQGKTLDFN